MYSCIYVIRFDTSFHKNVDEMNIDKDKFNLPWREYEEGWKTHHRVGDCVHVFHSKFLNILIQILQDKNYHETNFHTLYERLTKFIEPDDINFIEDGFYDSNSDIMQNPLYKIVRESSSQ